ncbi:MAG TPA: zinc ABC transporter substrate-binding protein [Alphaproteobacteria bacterium]|jgi:zinc/manganese transport system substrate-binding protein
MRTGHIVLFFGVALAALGTIGATAALADVNVFACEPEWASLTKELGGDKVSVYMATQASQDPHQIQARPSLIAHARAADLAVCTGAELEIGWLPQIQRQATNGKILPGAKGSFEAARYVHLLDVPERLDRADGDVHAAGNPHIQTDPRNIAAVAKPLADRLAELDPANAAYYASRYHAFDERWTMAMQGWTLQAASLRGLPIGTQHKNWTYLLDWLGMTETVTLEPKPGIPPSSGYLAQVVDTVRQQPIRLVIRAAYEDSRPSDFLKDRAGVPVAVLPFTVGGSDGAKDLFGLFDDTLNRLLAAANVR